MNIRPADLIRHQVLDWVNNSPRRDGLMAAWERLLSIDDTNLPPVVVPRETCKWGHPFTPENTRMRKGTRLCRKCGAEKSRKSLMKKMEKQNASMVSSTLS